MLFVFLQSLVDLCGMLLFISWHCFDRNNL